MKEYMRANKDVMELKYTMNYGSILMDAISNSLRFWRGVGVFLKRLPRV
jgi:hypothetical protein